MDARELVGEAIGMSGTTWTGVNPSTPSRSNKVAPEAGAPEALMMEDCDGEAGENAPNGKQVRTSPSPPPEKLEKDAVDPPAASSATRDSNPLATIGASHVHGSRLLGRIRTSQKREAWFERLADGHDHHGEPTWWNTPWYATPRMRHVWGDPQYEVHPGAQELFLDLIFVGVAYRVGLVLKQAFYNCIDDSSSSMGSYGSMSGSSDSMSDSSSAGRRLSPDSLYECVGFGRGALHAIAPFMCMYLLWRIETQHRAKFAVASKLHAVLDLLSNLLLILAAMRMCSVQSYRTQPGGDQPGMSRVLMPILLDMILWMCRTAELALWCGREAARTQSTAEVAAGFQVMCFWSAALALFLMDFGDDDSNGRARDGAAGLMWCGNVWWAFCSGLRTAITMHSESALPLERAMVCTNMGFIFHRNNEFMFLMLGETVLQIAIAQGGGGEVDAKPGLWAEPQQEYTAAAGLVLATCMMFAFRQIVERKISGYKRTNEQQQFLVKEETQLAERLEDQKRRDEQDKAKRAQKKDRRDTKIAGRRKSITVMLLRRKSCAATPPPKGNPDDPNPATGETAAAVKKKERNAKMTGFNNTTDPAVEKKAHHTLLAAMLQNELGNFLWQTRAVTVMLVGVAVKLAIYNPVAETDAFFSLQQRLGLGVPMTISFAINFFESVFFQNRHHYYALSQISKFPSHFACLAARGAVMGSTIGICFAPMTPAVQLAAQASLAVVQCALLHLQDHKCNIDSHKMHPAASLPQALHALRQRAQRNRNVNCRDTLCDSASASATVH